jgi:hypothetical protein
METLTGADTSPLVSVDAEDSIENRLLALLQYLASQYPDEGWDRFIAGNGAVRWDLVRVSGHSQGGSLAVFLAMQLAVDRTCFFSSPADYDSVLKRPAAWTFGPSATDPARFYAFIHQADLIANYSQVLQNWSALRMTGPVVTVDGAISYGGSHMLTSAAAWPGLVVYHNVPVVDASTPLDADADPIYLPVWRYACFQ